MRNFRFLRLFLLAFVMLAIPAASHAQVAVGVSIRVGPPPLPVYAQPICPGPRYIWAPGFWAYGPDGYYWVPGTWVLASEPGFLWTPGYWGWSEGFYVWHPGYWGRRVGFYGGINYGYGYPGVGFYGGEWRGREFFYNRSVTNVNVTVIHNTYNKTVINNNVTGNRVSYNGGAGGINAQPNREEMAAAREQHREPTAEQVQHREAAANNRALLASVNHGRPHIAATPQPGEFHGEGVMRANRPGEANREKGPRGERENGNRGNRDNQMRPGRNAHPNSAKPHNNPNRHPEKEKPNRKPDRRGERPY